MAVEISLNKATAEDSAAIQTIQKLSFKTLLGIYQDHETSPGAETLSRIKDRFLSPESDHFFIRLGGENIGYMRIKKLGDEAYRLSLLCIMPHHQGKGYAQQAITMMEGIYPHAKTWALDTIKQEKKLCYLYEKMGYRQTGSEKHIKDGMDLVDYEKNMAHPQ